MSYHLDLLQHQEAMKTKSSNGSEEEAPPHHSSEQDYVQLTDLPLISEASSNRKSSNTPSVPHGRTSTESTPRQKDDLSLNLRFENILALINSILQHFESFLHAEKPGPHLDVNKLTAFLDFLEGEVVLDLRIWSKDLTVNDHFALDRLDAIQQPGDKAALVLSTLGETMSEIGEKLLSLTACLDNPRDHTRFMSEISSAHVELAAQIKRLLSQKSAIKKILRDYSTEKPGSSERVVTMTQDKKAPNVLCLGLY